MQKSQIAKKVKTSFHQNDDVWSKVAYFRLLKVKTQKNDSCTFKNHDIESDGVIFCLNKSLYKKTLETI